MRHVLCRWMVVLVVGGCGEVPSDHVDAGLDMVQPSDESCTPSSKGSVPVDENNNGEVDEGCAWNFGTPHWLPPATGVAWQPNLLTPTWISPDGRRLYVGHGDNFSAPQELLVLLRTGRDAPFGPAAKLISPAFINYSVVSITFSQDELEAIVEARPLSGGTTGTDLYRLTRSSITETLGGMEKLTMLSTDKNEERPFLRADGKELVFSSGRHFRRAERASPSAAFGPAEDLGGIPADKEVNGVSLTADGHTLFFYGNLTGRYRIYRSHRNDISSGMFSTPEEVVALEPSGAYEAFLPVLSESTREIFFGSSQPWSPGLYGVWRAQICRQGACENQTIPCTGGVRSPDNLHCYVKPDTAQTEADLEHICTSGGGHLVDIQSAVEQALVWTTYGSESLWVGGFDDRPGLPECNTTGSDMSRPFPCAWGWESGAQWSYSNWGASPTVNEPQESGEEDCVAAYSPYGGKWADITCGAVFRGVCETVLYPTW